MVHTDRSESSTTSSSEYTDDADSEASPAGDADRAAPAVSTDTVGKALQTTQRSDGRSRPYSAISLNDRAVYYYTVECVVHHQNREQARIEPALKKHAMQYTQDSFDVRFIVVGNSTFLSAKDLEISDRTFSSRIAYDDRFEPLQAVERDADEYLSSPVDACHVNFRLQQIGGRQLSGLVTGNSHYSQHEILKILDAFSLFQMCDSFTNITATFGGQIFCETISTSDGYETRVGRRGQVVFNSRRDAVLYISDCTGQFYQGILVSKFLVAHFGLPVTSNHVLDDESSVEAARKVLRGVKVSIVEGSIGQKQIYTIRDVFRSAHVVLHLLSPVVEEMILNSVLLLDGPCVDIGTEDSPFIYPVAFCKIVPHQILTCSTPTSAIKSASSSSRASRVGKPESPTISRAIASGELDFCFLRVHSYGQTVSAPSSIADEAWRQLQSEIGKRLSCGPFVSAELNLCTSGKSVRTLSADLHRTVWSLAADIKAGSQRVLIVNVPDGMERRHVEELRVLCDVQFGVQCVIVHASQVRDRYRVHFPTASMVMYSDHLIRKSFAQALIRPTVEGPSEIGQLVGVHIAEFDENHRLISVVSVLGKTRVVETGLYTVDSSDCLAMFKHIAEEIRRLIGTTNLPTAIFQFIPEPFDSVKMEELVASQQLEILMQNQGSAALSLTNFSQIHLVRLAANCSTLLGIPATHIPSHETSDQVDKQMREEMLRMPKPEKILSGIYHYLIDPSKKPFRVTHRIPTKAPDTPIGAASSTAGIPQSISHIKYETYEKRSLPAMLYLARKASKRARIYARYIESEIDVIKLSTAGVHENVKNTLWFL